MSLPDLPPQESGAVGRMVAAMIRRQTRAGFRNVLWTPPAEQIPRQVILVANHHGWFDGYLLFLAAKALGRPVLDWIAAYESFPLFGTVGGMAFPPNDPAGRAATIKRTIRRMKGESRSLMLFAEGVLHAGPDLLPFGRSLEVVARAVPEAAVIPVGIVYAMGIHQRPEARLRFGAPVEGGEALSARTQTAVAGLLEIERRNRSEIVLLAGAPDINERGPSKMLAKRKREP